MFAESIFERSSSAQRCMARPLAYVTIPTTSAVLDRPGIQARGFWVELESKLFQQDASEQ